MQTDFLTLTQDISLKETRANFKDVPVWAKANFWIGWIMLISFVVITILCIVFTRESTLFYLAMVVYIWTGAYLILDAVHQANTTIRLRRFAAKNGFIFEHGQTIASDRPGTIFASGMARLFAALRTPSQYFFEIGNFQYIVNSGGTSNKFVYGFIRIKLPRRLPNLFLLSKRSGMPLPKTLQASQRLSLEGDFNKYFTVYAPSGYEPDALYILTPDIMQLFIEIAKDFTIEMVDDELYLYFKRKFNLTDPVTWHTYNQILQKISTKFNRQIDYYADDHVGDRSANIIAELGRRLRTGWSTCEIVFIGLIVACVMFLLYRASI